MKPKPAPVPDVKTPNNMRLYMLLNDSEFLNLLIKDSDKLISNSFQATESIKNGCYPVYDSELRDLHLYAQLKYQDIDEYYVYPDSAVHIKMPEAGSEDAFLDVRIYPHAKKKDLLDLQAATKIWLEKYKQQKHELPPRYMDLLYAVSVNLDRGVSFVKIHDLLVSQKLPKYNKKPPGYLLDLNELQKYYRRHRHWVKSF